MPVSGMVSTVIIATGSSLIPTNFTTLVPGWVSKITSTGSSVQSLVMTGLSGLGYSHMMVVNNTGSSVSVVNTPFVNPNVTPSNNAFTNTTRGVVLKNNTVAWDDILVYDAIYLRSNDGIVTSGDITINVW